MEEKPIRRHGFFAILITIIAIAGIATSIFLYFQYRNVANNPVIKGQIEAKDLVKKVSLLMFLPKEELPTVATISDYNKLKDQLFFKNGQNGDKLLIYSKEKIAILYNPKVNKIVNVGPLNLEQTAAPIRITLYNGTTTTGLTNTIEQQLKSKLNNVVISGKENAKNTYKKTLVVDLTGSQQKTATDLAVLLGGETGSLPDGETAPANSDLLVIIGK